MIDIECFIMIITLFLISSKCLDQEIIIDHSDDFLCRGSMTFGGEGVGDDLW